MCDTCVATGDVTLDGVTLFGKNSDREPNEAQCLEQIPATDYSAGSTVRCTYIAIPQVRHTHAVMLSRPFWMWGAEMGSNEFGLAIGNEAVFTKEPYDRAGGLTGMDLLRLALERAKNSREGIDVITRLIETHGQGGNCGYTKPFYYHNSFILADPRQAWVLETAGRQWAAREIHGTYAISNGLTIGRHWDLASDDLVANAVRNRWCRSASNFSFAESYSDKLYTALSCCRKRRARSLELLENGIGDLRPVDIASLLRDHGPANEGSFRPDSGFVTSSICNHTGAGPVRVSQTTGSLIGHLAPDRATFFATATAAPCTGIFKPVWVDTPLPGSQAVPGANWDESSLFWNHEVLHRLTITDYRRLKAVYSDRRDCLEKTFLDRAPLLRKADCASRAGYVAETWTAAGDAEIEWIEAVRQAWNGTRTGMLYSKAWDAINRKAGMSQVLSP